MYEYKINNGETFSLEQKLDKQEFLKTIKTIKYKKTYKYEIEFEDDVVFIESDEIIDFDNFQLSRREHKPLDTQNNMFSDDNSMNFLKNMFGMK